MIAPDPVNQSELDEDIVVQKNGVPASELLPVWMETCETCIAYRPSELNPARGDCVLLVHQKTHSECRCCVRRFQAREVMAQFKKILATFTF